MAESLTSARELLAAELRRLLWIELTLAGEVLPQLLEAAHATDLRVGLERHLLETERHVELVRHALSHLQANAEPEESPALRGLLAEHARLVERIEERGHALADLAHAAAAAAIEHLEIAAYDALAALADALGEEELATTLREVMEQESFALEQVERARTALLATRVEAAQARP